MPLSDFSIGVLLCVGTCLFFGSWPSLNKLPQVRASNIRPHVFNLYFILGVIFVSIVIAIGLTIAQWDFRFTYLGVISGICLVLVGFFAFIAIPRIGVSATPLVAGPASIIASVIYSAILGQQVGRVDYTVIGFLMVIFGGFGVAATTTIMSYIRRLFGIPDPESGPTMAETDSSVVVDGVKVVASKDEIASLTANVDGGDDGDGNGHGGDFPPANPHATVTEDDVDEAGASQTDKILHTDEIIVPVDEDDTRDPTIQKIIGLAGAIGHGWMMASVPLPTLFTDEYTTGVSFLPSMAVGCLFVFPLTFIIVLFETGWEDFFPTLFDGEFYQWRSCLLPGIGAGLLWGTGNVAGIYAFQYIEFFLVIAFVQCNAIVSEIYGIAIYKEITKFADIIFFVLCSFVIIVGCALLAIGVYDE